MYFDFRDKPDRLCVKEMVHGYNISSCLFVASSWSSPICWRRAQWRLPTSPNEAALIPMR